VTDWPPDIFRSERWQMSLGERAALEGLLSQLRPELSIEIGTAEGGSLERIAAHSHEVHSIDIVSSGIAAPGNAHLHTGDSREVLPRLLERFDAEGRTVDFVLVDGDHSAGGVEGDLVDLLSSPAVNRTVIVVHDTLNEEVRKGVAAIRFHDYPKVSYVHLDFLTGYVASDGPFAGQLWGGFGLVLVDAGGRARRGDSVYEDHLCDAPTMVRIAAGRLRRRSIVAPLRALRARGGRSRARFGGRTPNL
jgi:hypothetical protein